VVVTGFAPLLKHGSQQFEFHSCSGRDSFILREQTSETKINSTLQDGNFYITPAVGGNYKRGQNDCRTDPNHRLSIKRYRK
jgi:hypothetical protein